MYICTFLLLNKVHVPANVCKHRPAGTELLFGFDFCREMRIATGVDDLREVRVPHLKFEALAVIFLFQIY